MDSFLLPDFLDTNIYLQVWQIAGRDFLIKRKFTHICQVAGTKTLSNIQSKRRVYKILDNSYEDYLEDTSFHTEGTETWMLFA